MLTAVVIRCSKHLIPNAPNIEKTLVQLGLGVLSLESRSVLSLEQSFSVLVELDLGDHDVGWVDAHCNRLTVSLLSANSLDVDDVLLTIALGDLSLSISEVTSNNHDFVFSSDGKRSDVVLLAKLLRQWGGHSDASLV